LRSISTGSHQSHNFAVHKLNVSREDARSVCPDHVSNHLLYKPHSNLPVVYML